MSGVSLSTIRAMESRIGVTLPDDYRVFIAQHNGWNPHYSNSWVLADKNGERRKSMNTSIYPILWEGEQEGVGPIDMGVLGHFREELGEWIPEDSLAIGSCAGNKIIVLYWRGTHCGQVWIKSMDESEGEPDYRNAAMYYCAPTFTAFIESLCSNPGDGVKWLDEP